MKIGILQTGHAMEQIQQVQGDYDAMFARLLDGNGFDYVTFNVVDNEFPNGAEAADGWLITGSRHGAYEDHDWIPPLEALIREIYAAGRPLIGICFGHQIIAQALGGRVEKFSGGWDAGLTEYEIEGENLALNAWHQDQVVERPQDARVIGSTPFCQYAALAYGDRILTYQPHPEFDEFVIEQFIEHRGKGVLSDKMMDKARAGLTQSTGRDQIAKRMAEFFRQER